MENHVNNVVLEKYEWDSLWWEQTGESQKPRVLYIGDSISDGLRRYAQKGSKDGIMCGGSRPGTMRLPVFFT